MRPSLVFQLNAEIRWPHPHRLIGILLLTFFTLVASADAQAACVPIDDLVAADGDAEGSCALDADGDVFCWGKDTNGWLGTGTSGNVPLPLPVIGLPGPMNRIAVGDRHQCALDEIGAVWCWGLNGAGMLGDGTTTDRTNPAPVVGLGAPAVAIDAGNFYYCAVTDAADLACWGGNYFGRLGDGTNLGSIAPVTPVGLGSGVIQVVTTEYSACALSNAVAVQVIGLESGVKHIGAGSIHRCALMNSGQLRCWGRQYLRPALQWRSDDPGARGAGVDQAA